MSWAAGEARSLTPGRRSGAAATRRTSTRPRIDPGAEVTCGSGDADAVSSAKTIIRAAARMSEPEQQLRGDESGRRDPHTVPFVELPRHACKEVALHVITTADFGAVDRRI